MLCKLCGRDIERKFYLHLNRNHKMSKVEYLRLFPEQSDEYLDQVSIAWNKGLTAADHPSVAKYTKAVREYSNRDDVRKDRSIKLKDRYRNGDILTPEVRAKVVKKGSDGWKKKIQSCDFTERRRMLSAFTTAGNKAQAERRLSLTPDDYNRLYPFAKGKARYHECDYCGKSMIAWFGGKPRPKRRFCNQGCHHAFQQLHPNSTLPQSRMYYSELMGLEFCLHSNLEVSFAKLLDDRKLLWCTPPFFIPYDYSGKQRRYYPDFLVCDKHVIELKSDYILRLQGEGRSRNKLSAADKFCSTNGYCFHYWQFDGPGCYALGSDPRVVRFLSRMESSEWSTIQEES